MNPLVSVIVPCYNQGIFLSETLESVLNQTFSDWECLIIDDGSTDDTCKVAKSYVVKDSRFSYLKKENGGVSSARNLGLDNAKGSYIQFLDSDDILAVRKLEISLDKLKLFRDKDLKIAISNFRMFTENIAVTSDPFCVLEEKFLNFEGFLYHWNSSFSLQIQCGFFEASLFDHIRFPENLSAQEDWVVWVSLFKTGTEAIFINEPLAYYRVNPDSRMSTIGIDDNKVKVLDNFKTILTYDEYYQFSSNLISRLYDSLGDTKSRLKEVRKSNSYQTGLMIKKILKKICLLSISKSFFKIILKFKTK